MKAKPWIIGVLIFVAGIVVPLAAFGATILWDIFQTLRYGL